MARPYIILPIPDTSQKILIYYLSYLILVLFLHGKGVTCNAHITIAYFLVIHPTSA
jgi:hypothetical protein